jgi:hypothetical protein
VPSGQLLRALRASQTWQPGEMVPEFDAYCFDPTTEKGVIGVVGSSFGTHLVRLDKQSLEGGARAVKARRMADTPDPETGLRT